MTTQQQFFGATPTVYTVGADLTNGSCVSLGLFDNVADARLGYAGQAVATMEAADFSGAPTTGAALELWGVLRSTDGTEHDTDPPVSTSDLRGARFFGDWVVDNVDALQRRTVTVSLEGVEHVEFYLANRTGTSLLAGSTVTVCPAALGVTV